MSSGLAWILVLGALSGPVLAQEKVISVRRLGNNVEIRFIGAADATYQVEKSTTLAAGSWTDLGLNVTGTGVEQTVALSGAGTPVRQFFRLVPTTIPGFVFIPGGSFRMGDPIVADPAEGAANERPVIDVAVHGFYMKTTEVTKEEWDAVKTYATGAGYDFSSNAGLGKAAKHPVYSLSWLDAIKWCNAKSEQAGLQPCYVVTNTGLTYRSGTSSSITWSLGADGYRLPSEAEWEKAARGGLSAQRFPWGMTISRTQANYNSSSLPYDTTGASGYHPTYAVGSLPYTAPVGSFAANGYGLFDVEGNVRELCWDSPTNNYNAGYVLDDTHSGSATTRVIRGGDWSSTGYSNRCSYRDSQLQSAKNNSVGFRLARGRVL